MRENLAAHPASDNGQTGVRDTAAFPPSTFFRQFCTLTASNRSPAKAICLTVFPPELSRLR